MDLGLYFILAGTGLLMAVVAVVGSTFVGRRITAILATHDQPDLLRRAWNPVRRMGRAAIASGVVLAVVLTYENARRMSTGDVMWLFALLFAVPLLFFPAVAYRMTKVSAAVTP